MDRAVEFYPPAVDLLGRFTRPRGCFCRDRTTKPDEGVTLRTLVTPGSLLLPFKALDGNRSP